jgi:integrase
LVNPGNPPRRHQTRSKADPARTYHRMVTLAQSTPGGRSARPSQKNTTVMLGGMLTYAVEQGIIEKNPAHGIRKPADRVKDRRLTEDEYRLLGKLLEKHSTDEQFQITVRIIRFLALTGCRRGEAIHLKWEEVDENSSCIRLIDSKEGKSVRAIGLPVVDLLDLQRIEKDDGFVFQGSVEGKPLVGFPKLWKKLFKDTALANVTPHVLRHSFTSIANDLGFTEATIGALVGHSRDSVTGRYIHTVDTLLVMAADTVAGFIKGLLEGKRFRQTSYALDRASREATLARLFEQSIAPADGDADERIAA